MKFPKLLFTVALPLFTAESFAAENIKAILPESGFVLLDSSRKPEPKTQFISSRENGYLVLKSALSPQWQKGIYFNLQNGRVTVPGIGAANLVQKDKSYAWNTSTVELTFQKHGSMTLTRMAQGCEMVWNFSVISRGKELVNESGRLAYACGTEAHLAVSPSR